MAHRTFFRYIFAEFYFQTSNGLTNMANGAARAQMASAFRLDCATVLLKLSAISSKLYDITYITIVPAQS